MRFFVAHDNVGGLEIDEPLQAVVAVDDPPVEIVEIRSGEAPALQRHQRPQVRGQHRDDVHDHPGRFDPRAPEGVDDLKALGEFLALGLGARRLDLRLDFRVEGLQVQLLQKLFDRFGTDPGLEFGPVGFQRLAVFFVGQQLVFTEPGVLGIDDDVAVEVEDLLHAFKGQIQQVADLAGQALQKPDVGARRGQFDMPHALPPDLGLNDLHAALFADHTAVFHPFVFAAVALVILGGPEDLGAEKPVALRFEGAVVDGLGFFDLPVGPLPDLLRRGQADLNGGVVARIGGLGKKIV